VHAIHHTTGERQTIQASNGFGARTLSAIHHSQCLNNEKNPPPYIHFTTGSLEPSSLSADRAAQHNSRQKFVSLVHVRRACLADVEWKVGLSRALILSTPRTYADRQLHRLQNAIHPKRGHGPHIMIQTRRRWHAHIDEHRVDSHAGRSRDMQTHDDT